MRATRALLGVVAALGMIAGCEGGTQYFYSGPDGDGTVSYALSNKVEECGAGDLWYTVPLLQRAIVDSYDLCVAKCVIDASCEDVVPLFCPESSAETPLFACVSTCPQHPEDGRPCADGVKVPLQFHCDGIAHCPDASDERDCTYRCADGQVLPFAPVKCDGEPQCDDGSDEYRCAEACGQV